MATLQQINALRKKINDYVDKEGNLLTSANQCFVDEELESILNDAFVESSDGKYTFSDAPAYESTLAMLLARIDALLQLAQDESRRIRWQVNNKIVDESTIAMRLTKIAEQIKQRYEASRSRKQEQKIEGASNANCGGVAVFNSTVVSNANRKFDTTNKNIKRNQPRW